MIAIKFHYNYFKLSRLTFTTIRGKSWMKKIKPGMQVELQTPTGSRMAKVLKVELRRINEIPLNELKADAEFPGYKIENTLQFVSLLNSFRQKIWTSKPVAADDEMAVITLQQ